MPPFKLSNANSMAAIIPTRRSPRSIGRFCNGILLPGMTIEQTATLFALSHCTGWCADRITNKFRELTGIELQARQAWDIHRAWVGHRGGEHLAAEDIEVMQVLLLRAGVIIPTFGAPLNKTMCPQTVKFATSWSPKNPASNPLFPGFTVEARQQSKEYISLTSSKSAYGKLTPVERGLVALFGHDMTLIFKDVLKRWARTMWGKLRKERDLRPIRDMEHVGVIMEYLKVFQDEYESKFGKMEESSCGQLGEIIDDAVYIKSTGYGAKVFLGLMMADRLHVVDRKRRRERYKIGFVELDASKLKNDSRDCPVCQDPMGVANPEGSRETPIKLIICCGQVLGRQCLKTWLSEFVYGNLYRETCPICRFKFPETFIEKLFPGKEYLARFARQDEIEVADMASQSPTPSA